jgi:hypothetical protein
MSYATGEITPERIELTQLFDERLKPFLTGARNPADRDEITRRYLDGSLGEALLEVAMKKKRRQPAAPRPSVEHRRKRVQEWMLSRYAERGVLARVIEEATLMQNEEIDRWMEIAGARLQPSSLQRYWQLIDDDRVEQAKAEYARRHPQRK